MAMKLDKVVPFGRSLDEYKCMFNLSPVDLDKKIIGVSDGPASFNAEMKKRGKSIVSIDPLYQFDAKEIDTQFYHVVDNIISQVKQTPDDWVWTYHNSPDQLRENRVIVLNKFTRDFEAGKLEKRYIVGELPTLNIESNQYEMALCSHFLFLYSEQFDYDFHLSAILEMLRIAEEVRIFPLLTLNLEKTPYLEPLLHELKSQGYLATVEKVKYEIQKGGNEMLRVTKI
ncbi:MAG: SAM-dependent methyltransferase [Methylococcales bacterium]|nr:SAM-dependent methyltransferase [Methylococcales bacterium]